MTKKRMPKNDTNLFDMIEDVLGALYKDIKKNVLSHIPKYAKRLEKELKLAQRRIMGQKVSLIGPPAVGKTSMLKVLRNREIERTELESYKKTGAGESYSSFNVTWNIPIPGSSQIEYSFKVAAGTDNGGEDYIREGHWLEAIQDSSIIFYLFDFEKFNNSSSREKELQRILKDFDWIGGHVNALKPNFSLVLVGNKLDLLCSSLRDFRKIQNDKQGVLNELRDEILNCIPKGYHQNIQPPVLMSLFDKQIRNEQFTDLMLSVIGTDLVKLIKECEDFKKEEEAA